MKLVNIHKQMGSLLLFIIGLPIAEAQVWTLQQCIDTAQVHNINLQISRNNISIGDQKAKEAKANLIPKLTANADYKYFTNLPYQLMPMSVFNPSIPEGQFKEAQFGVPHNINTNLQLSIPLYNPQVYGAIQSTALASELTELQYQKSEEQIYLEISNLYYNAQLLHHQLAFMDTNLLNATRLLSITQLLHEQLLAKGTDVNKINLQIAQLNTQKESVSGKYKQVLNALKFAMGLSIGNDLEIEPNIQYHNTNEYTRSLTIDIRLLKTQNRILSSELKTLSRSRILPTFNLIGMYGTSGFGYDQQPNGFLKFYPIGFAGIQFSYPVFNGTVTQRKIIQKKFELHNSELQIDLIAEQNMMLLENSKLQRMAAKKAVETSREQIQMAQVIYKQTIIQQQQGTASVTDVLLADNALREAQQTYLSAVIDYLKADLELKKLSGNISTHN